MLNSMSARRAMIVARFEELLQANYTRPLVLAEICAATGVSERTLRNCCHEYLGMSPIRYACLWRMHLARNALMLANLTSANVTRIAGHFGFSELGRFSVNYCALFGESPSATLRRPSRTASPKAPAKVGAGRVNSAAPLGGSEPASVGMQS
jgi:transcriptional regulator GlxA family with amidase domain